MRNKILYVLLGCLLGSCITFILLKQSYHTETQPLVSTIDFQESNMIPFNLKKLGLEPIYDENLHILFHEDKFCIKSGKTFYYDQRFIPIKENWQLPMINPMIICKKGIILYTIQFMINIIIKTKKNM